MSDITNARDLTAKSLIARLHSSESNEWYTPEPYIEAARTVLGGIALDAASSAAAQITVKADRYYSKENGEDGLALPWVDRWFNNPPYGWRKWEGRRRSNQELWTKKAAAEWEEFNRSGIMLINSNTEVTYMRPLWRFWKCFTDHRIKFDLPPGAPPKDQPTKGNVFIYFGLDWRLFGDTFSQFGQIVPPLPEWEDGPRYAAKVRNKLY